MQWIATAPPGRSKDWAVQSAVLGWWRNDRQGLSDYVEAMAQTGIEPWFQPGLEKYAYFTGVQSGNEAARQGIQWALLIEDDHQRTGVLVNIARTWRRRDESAADAWLDQSPLSEEIRTRVRTPQQRQKPARAPIRFPASPPPAP